MTPEEKERELQKQQEALTRGQQLQAKYDEAEGKIRQIGEQQVNDINGATQQAIDTLNADQQAYMDAMAGYRTSWQNDMNAGMGGVEALVKEGETRLQREREIAQAEYLASQRASQATGLTHLASSIANLIAVGGFNASNQVYENPSIDWMRKADQDRQIARQRMDNLRDRQRQLQQHQLELKMNMANQAYGMDSALAGQDLEHRRGIANTRLQTAREAANIRSQAERQAIETGLQGATAKANADYQDRSLAQSAQQHRDSVNMTAARYGLKRNSDGTFSLDPDAEINQLNSAARRNSSGGSKNTYYYTDPDGNLIPVYMTASEYDKFVEQSYAALKDNPDFKKAYDATKFSSGSDLDRKSLIFNYATMDDGRRRVLSQYGPAPEGAQRKSPRATGYGVLKQPTEVRLVDGSYVTVDNTDITGGGVSAGGYGSAADLDALLPKK